jgi:uncharacterized membrane protein YtjA (UPF0391 family)
MLGWTFVFLVMAITMAWLSGFGIAAVGAILIARVLFFIFVMLFLGGVLYGLVTGRRPPMPPVL